MPLIFLLLSLYSGISFANIPKIYPDEICLFNALYHESRGEVDANIYDVGLVIKQRVLDDRFPNTFCDVIKQKGQFEFYGNTKWFNKIDFSNKLHVKLYNIVVHITSGEDVRTGILYFHDVSLKNERILKWFNSLTFVKKKGRLLFYKD